MLPLDVLFWGYLAADTLEHRGGYVIERPRRFRVWYGIGLTRLVRALAVAGEALAADGALADEHARVRLERAVAVAEVHAPSFKAACAHSGTGPQCCCAFLLHTRQAVVHDLLTVATSLGTELRAQAKVHGNESMVGNDRGIHDRCWGFEDSRTRCKTTLKEQGAPRDRVREIGQVCNRDKVEHDMHASQIPWARVRAEPLPANVPLCVWNKPLPEIFPSPAICAHQHLPVSVKLCACQKTDQITDQRESACCKIQPIASTNSGLEGQNANMWLRNKTAAQLTCMDKVPGMGSVRRCAEGSWCIA